MGRPIKRAFVHAYACDPTEGSEPGAGWRAALATLESADEVVIFTRSNNASAVRSALDELGLSARTEVVGFDLDRRLQRIKKRVPGGTQLYYLMWQRLAVPSVRELHKALHFDVAVHATIAVDWLPTSLQG